jgi:hypothetical protein
LIKSVSIIFRSLFEIPFGIYLNFVEKIFYS